MVWMTTPQRVTVPIRLDTTGLVGKTMINTIMFTYLRHAWSGKRAKNGMLLVRQIVCVRCLFSNDMFDRTGNARFNHISTKS